MIKPIYIIVGLLLLITVKSLCPTACTNCTNSTSCDICQTGYFMVDNATCPRCPTGCSRCVPDANQRPNCTACIAPFKFNSFQQKCFLCSPSCQDCVGTPTNCTQCPDGKQLYTSNGLGSCGPLANCSYTNCAQCATPDVWNITVCARCLPGYFAFLKGCAPCKFPSTACTYDVNGTWDSIIAPFWNTTAYLALNLTSQPPPGTLPDFMYDLNFTTMPPHFIRGWTQAYFVLKAIPSFELSNTTIILLKQQYDFYNTLVNLTEQDRWNSILQRINLLSNKTWTDATFLTALNLYAADSTTYTQCANGYFLLNSTYCQRCSANCLSCTNATCGICAEGYFYGYLGGYTGCVPCNTTSCLGCDITATRCTKCAPPATLSSYTCIICDNPCATCSPTNTSLCLTCKAPFVQIPDNSSGCYRCDQDLCSTCDPANRSICLQCKSGASLSQGVCGLCPSNCVSCSTRSPPVCLRCAQGFSLATVNNVITCAPCGRGCISCSQSNASICLACQVGTYLDTVTTTCLRCKQGCKECTSLDTCIVFEQGVVIIAGNVVACRPGCKVCDPESPNICIQCQPRFFLNSQVCKSCGSGCDVCTSATVCTRCLGNAVLNTGSCTTCQGACATCQTANATACLSCKRGFAFINNTCVRQCEAGCLQCDPANSTICLTCLIGNALTTNGKCIKCLGSCSGSCDPRNITMCTGCVDGFQLLSNKCVRCPEGCTTCVNGDCSGCVGGYTLNQNSTGSFICTLKCKSPCATCNGDTCSACQAGFNLTNNVCQPDLSCNPDCPFCPSGTEKEANGSCTACPTGCSACASGVCAQCLPGLFLNSSICTPCASQCRTCFSATSCDTCAPGFVKQILSMDQSSGVSSAVYSDRCIACSTNCLTCQVDPERCTSCPQGTRLYSSRCAGLFNVVYSYELAVNYATFLLNSQSDTFVNSIAALTGANPNDTYINSITQGSTIVGGNVATSNKQAAQGVQSSLGSSLPGFTVLSSSASIYYGDTAVTPAPETATAQPVNVGLIVGVVLGSVALIVIIAVIIYKCKNPSVDQIDPNGTHLQIMPSNGQDTRGVVIQKH